MLNRRGRSQGTASESTQAGPPGGPRRAAPSHRDSGSQGTRICGLIWSAAGRGSGGGLGRPRRNEGVPPRVSLDAQVRVKEHLPPPPPPPPPPTHDHDADADATGRSARDPAQGPGLPGGGGAGARARALMGRVAAAAGRAVGRAGGREGK